MPEREQVHAGLHRQRGVRREQRGRLDQTVGTVAALEAHVVADRHVVEPGRRDLGRQRAQPPPLALDVLLAKHDPDGDAHVVSPADLQRWPTSLAGRCMHQTAVRRCAT